ncbi:MAG TPA: DNA ligase, partial [Candidatus Dormibacteraeota bacterium]|nr:DNA ligase [Candidatus Dormibacteraeota bacterium]
MLQFAQTGEKIKATASKLEKVTGLADYLRTLDPASLQLAATYFTGRPFGLKDPRTLNLGWRALVQAVEQVSGRSAEEMRVIHSHQPDLGGWAEEALHDRTHPQPITLVEIDSALERIRLTETASARIEQLGDLLARLEPVEAGYLVRILSGEVRIGLQSGLVEEAIAAAFGGAPTDVRRAHMLTGDLGETAVLAAQGKLDRAAAELGRPVRYMLASPVSGPEEALERMGGGPLWAEEKYDGVRCQFHRTGSEVLLFSRDLRETTLAFPEVAEAGRRLEHQVILDGEILGHRAGKVLRFFELQRRLGRKVVSAAMRKQVPVVL